MSRYIDADAYAAEMKVRQDALKELIDDAVAMDNWEMYDGLSRALSIFVEAKLTLDAMPTVDAVQVVRCKECKHGTIMKNYFGDEMVQCGCEKNPIGRWNDYERWLMPKGFYCADGERKDNETKLKGE